MRIRRRPQGQSLSSLLLPSDPSAPTAPAQDRQDREKREEVELHPNAPADLGDGPSSSPPPRRAALLPLLPQDNAAECRRGLGAHQHQQGTADAHRSLENGHYYRVPEPAIRAGERLSNGGGGGTAATMPVTAMMDAGVMRQLEMKEDSSGSGGGGMKKRRGPGVLLEGSRCSRMNGRGWRCSQPTLVGYALCEHHLGKGRMRSAAAGGGGGGRGGPNQLGRTEHGKRAVAAAPPKPDVPPPHC